MRTKLFRSGMAKSLALALACTTILTGCGNKNTTVSKTAEDLPDATYELDNTKPAWQIDDNSEETTLTWYVNADWWNTEYGNDFVTKKIKEDLNLNIEFTNGDDTKLNTLFAGGKKPDIITIFDGASSTAKKADTWALSLNDLADKYDPYFYEIMQEETFNWYSLEDGKTYGYPSFSNTAEDYESGYINGTDALIIRQDIYEGIGSPKMETPEEFLSALKLIKEKYPDVIPFGFRGFGNDGNTGSIGDVLQNYLGVPITTEDGEFYDRNLDEEYLRWIKVLNEAYLNGYISDDNFSDDNTIFEEKISGGKYACAFISGAPQLSGPLQRNIEEDANRKYIAIDGPKSSLGNERALSQAGISGWTVSYITNDCSNPQEAMQLFTYLLSDYGKYLCNFGVEGETYHLNENGEAVLNDDIAELKKTDVDRYKTEYRFGEFWFFGHDRFIAEHGEEKAAESVAQIFEWTSGMVKPQFILENIDPKPGTAEARNLINIKTNWATTLASLLRSKDQAEFDKIIENYKKFLEDNNYEDILKIRNENMKINAEKLGL